MNGIGYNCSHGHTGIALLQSRCATMVFTAMLLLAGFANAAHAESSPWQERARNMSIYLAATTPKKAPASTKQQTVRRSGNDFDHLLTGFPLFGAHVGAKCEACHVHGILKGTPRQCAQCHGNPGMRAATFKPATHVRTQLPCDQCHNDTVWSGARFDHSEVPPGTCLTCHNGTTAPAKPTSNHPVTTESCDSCHRTTAWRPAHFNHAGVTPGTCATCHGVSATGKPSNHMVTTSSCDACHSTTAWKPASGHGTGVTPGTCNNCHLNDKGANHFVLATPRSCDECHSDTRWKPIIGYSHTGGFFPGQHKSSVTCNNCHNGTEIIAWPNPADKAFCGGCHKKDFKQDSHKKYLDVKYSYDELKDCTTSCHYYTDSTLTVIKDRHNSKHKASDGGF